MRSWAAALLRRLPSRAVDPVGGRPSFDQPRGAGRRLSLGRVVVGCLFVVVFSAVATVSLIRGEIRTLASDLSANKAIATSPGALVFANFDGVRGADIAVLRGTQWGFYPDGSGAWTPLRTPALAELQVPLVPLVGKFTSDSIADALQWTLDLDPATNLYHAGAYFQLATSARGNFAQWSRHHMR